MDPRGDELQAQYVSTGLRLLWNTWADLCKQKLVVCRQHVAAKHGGSGIAFAFFSTAQNLFFRQTRE